MQFEAKIEGALEIEKALAKLELRIEKNISRRAVAAGAKVLVAEIKSRVPVNTGTLRRSIGIKRIKMRKVASVVIGPRVGKGRQERKGKTGKTIKNSDGWYGRLIEFGTINQSPKPFMRPAFDTKANETIKRTAAVFREGIARER